jgi:hypothetical protein
VRGIGPDRSASKAARVCAPSGDVGRACAGRLLMPAVRDAEPGIAVVAEGFDLPQPAVPPARRAHGREAIHLAERSCRNRVRARPRRPAKVKLSLLA